MPDYRCCPQHDWEDDREEVLRDLDEARRAAFVLAAEARKYTEECDCCCFFGGVEAAEALEAALQWGPSE